VGDWGEFPGLPPSLRFAAEGIEAQRELSDFHEVKSNALLAWQNVEEFRDAAIRAHRDGYGTLKVKVYPENLDQIVPALASVEGLDISLRLDANASLTAALAENLFRKLDSSGLGSLVEYIEEPYPDWWRSDSVCAPFPLAADESAHSPERCQELLAAPRAPDVFILKPTVLGGLSSLRPLRQDLESRGKKVVFTSALETEAGRRSLIAFLAAEGIKCPAGLATGSLFAENELPDRATYHSLPRVGAAERDYYAGLAWRELKR
jgi:L-alanine-DL-glutamate epimerase-like enolase superfamily enzyme